jgi:phosphatidylglycerol:prolipoprotein diacylglycerol transferase
VIPWFRFDAVTLPGLSNGPVFHVFGFLVGVGVLAGASVAKRRAQRVGLDPRVMTSFILYIVVIGFIGSHVFERLAYDPARVLREPWDLLMPWRSMSSFGGFGSALAGAFIWKARRGMNITLPLDQVAFGMPVAWLFGRTGCFFVHDHPGALTQFFLGVRDYRYGSLVVGQRHDLGLYEALWSAAVIPLFFYLDREPRPEGFFIGLIAVLYSPFRFGLDFLRAADATYFGLTPAQYASAVSLIAGIWFLGVIFKARTQPAADLVR